MRASFAKRKIEIFIAAEANEHNELARKGKLVLPLLEWLPYIQRC
jgi:hypothetical protein